MRLLISLSYDGTYGRMWSDLGRHHQRVGKSQINVKSIRIRKVCRMERTILEALGYYLIRLVMFGATAAAGIAVGIKLRKNKNAKEEANTEN